MRLHRPILMMAVIALTAGCQRSVDVDREREALLVADRAWSESTTDAERFLTFFAPDASVYPPGMAKVSGAEALRETWEQMSSAPGFSLRWKPDRAEVAASGDVGYTTGTYELASEAGTEQGKYVTVWKKQPDGTWKAAEDIFNADETPRPAPAKQTLMPASEITFGDPPPFLPAGAKFVILSGDPSRAGPYVARAQFPRGYRVPPHWHPADENVTVISGTFSYGLGEKFDETAMKDIGPGSFALMPAEVRHYAMARTAAVIQIHGIGPSALNYVNPADDPRKQAR